MQKRMFIINKDVYEEPFDDKTWEVLLRISKNMALERSERIGITEDKPFHILYGYVCPNIGHYVSALECMDDNWFSKFVTDIYKKDKDVMIYAVHSRF